MSEQLYNWHILHDDKMYVKTLKEIKFLLNVFTDGGVNDLEELTRNGKITIYVWDIPVVTVSKIDPNGGE